MSRNKLGKSKAAHLTLCPECGREVGAVRDTFNIINNAERDLHRSRSWRVIFHYAPGRGRCIGARIEIPTEAVYPRKEPTAA